MIFYFVFIFAFNAVRGRIVPAKSDICDRYPGFSALCPGKGQPPPPSNDVAAPPAPAPPPPPTPPPVQTQQKLNKQKYCQTYVDHYTYFCDKSTPAGGKPRLTQNIVNFCANFPKTCPSVKISDLSELNATDESVVQECLKQSNLARSFCTGDEKNPDIRLRCDRWRKYCQNNPKVNPSYLSDPNIGRICQDYTYMANQYCPGYESINLRQYCNYYRVYCEGKKAFPNIDGNVGIVTNNWGVGGIPYYPFNPQGAIAGGKRFDVGFGDWGADFNNRGGVTDFFEDSNQFAANWQRGNFGGGYSWNVPLVGIGGYNRNGVSLGGIANFQDLPAMLSGGVPQGAPLSGLAQIPLSQGLPVPQASTGGGVNTLNSPLGTGNLGLIGALAQGAPISAGPIGPLAQFGGLGRKKRRILYSAKQ